MFDGWTDNNIHYVSVISTYVYDGECYEKMLACAPLMQEDDLSATQHVQVLHDTLDVYGKALSNIACFIGDNAP